MINKDYLKKQLYYELCRRDFWEYCKATEPDFYKEGRAYLKDYCKQLQEFVENDERYMIVNMPPQHGKTRTLKKLAEWKIGNDRKQRIFAISYNHDYATDLSKNVLNAIRAEHEVEEQITFSDIFPDLIIKRGDGAKNRWSVEGGFNTWLSASPNTGVTGRSATLVIIDDIIKDYAEAINRVALDKTWSWFANTLFSRKGEGKRKIIICMTRWSKYDLAGRVEDTYDDIRKIVFKAYDDKTKKMLCDDILSIEDYQEILKTTRDFPELIAANYNQEPIDVKFRLYHDLLLYDPNEIKDFVEVYSYCDTADQGQDFLCNIIWGIKNRKCYILDVYYTQEAMEITEPETAKRLKEYGVNYARIESNSGGRGFARSVVRISEDKLKNFKTTIKTFTQSQNKLSRIRSNATWVMENIYFPNKWHLLWPEFYRDICEFVSDGGNLHDDCADALTGVAETSQTILK